MLIQILRTVLFGAVVYFLSKIVKNMIDRRLDPPRDDRRVPPHGEDMYRPPPPRPENGARERLAPCPVCGIYFHAQSGQKHCGREDCLYTP